MVPGSLRQAHVTTHDGVCPSKPSFSISGQEEADHVSRIMSAFPVAGKRTGTSIAHTLFHSEDTKLDFSPVWGEVI